MGGAGAEGGSVGCLKAWGGGARRAEASRRERNAVVPRRWCGRTFADKVREEEVRGAMYVRTHARGLSGARDFVP